MDTLTPFFDWILAASARASLLTVVVLIAQALLRYRVSARWRHALWLPVLIVLLMPAFPESSWSVSSITRMAPVPLPHLPVIGQSVAAPAPPPLAAATEMPVPIPWQRIMVFAWLVGAAGMVLFGVVSFAQTLWRFQRSRLPLSGALQRELAVLARGIGLRQVPRVWVASAIRSPAVTGLLRPTLLLPAHFEQALSPHETHLVLKHELMHIKRGDLPIHALLCLLLALHWFNPLLWLAFFKARLDREAACDAQVLDRENQIQRVAYGHTLLKVETAFSQRGLNLGFAGIFQRGAALRARIQSIASPANSHPLMKAALSLSIVLLTFLGITRAVTPDPKAPHILIQAKMIEITEQDPAAPGAAPLPAPFDTAPKTSGLVGTFADPQTQVMLRTLSQRKGVDLVSAPNVTTRDGQQAKMEVVREFVYPGEAGKQVIQNVGVTLAVIPKITADGQIALDLSPQIVEFEGFEHPKSGAEEPIVARKVLHTDGTSTESTNDVGEGELRESQFNVRGELLSQTTTPSSKSGKDAFANPIFTKRMAKVNAVITSGNTTVLEMEVRTDKQLVEETDGTDRIISSKTVLYKRRLLIFVTAYLVDPATGKPRLR